MKTNNTLSREKKKLIIRKNSSKLINSYTNHMSNIYLHAAVFKKGEHCELDRKTTTADPLLFCQA